MKRTIAYWVVTALALVPFVMGGVMDLMRTPEMVAGMNALGYPAYVCLILGFWKLAGAATVAAPRFPLLKEWAYAGMVFDLTGAAFSHAASGDPAGKIMTPIVILAFVAASWWLRPASRRLISIGGVSPTDRSVRAAA